MSMIYTTKEVASIIKCNPNYVYSLINAGLLPAIKLGSMKVRHEALECFLAKYEGYDLSDVKEIKQLNPPVSAAK